MKRLLAGAALFFCMLMIALPAAQAEDMLDVLLIGVDSRNPDQPGRSDTMMLCRIDPAQGEIRLVSFLRDLYVRIPGHGKTRLNAAWFHGGEALLKQTLKENFGITVDRTVTVHFSALIEMIDAIGGVEIEVTEKERRHLNQLLEEAGAAPLAFSGLQNLNGSQALYYSRIRKIDSDFQRTSRQQAIMAAALERVRALETWEILKLGLRAFRLVQTDMRFREISSLLPMLKQADSLQIKTAQVPFHGTYAEETIDGMMVLNPDLKRNRTLLQNFLD